MSENKYKPQKREEIEPSENANPWPYALTMFVGAMIGWGASYLYFTTTDGDVGGGDARTKSTVEVADVEVSETSPAEVDGAAVYAKICTPCHQANGQGLPGAFPPLANSEWVNGDPKVVARIVLKGVSGPIQVAGQSYNSAMPAFESQLNDAEIAAVISHVRSNFGNQAEGAIAAADVKALRAEHANQKEAFTPEKLK